MNFLDLCQFAHRKIGAGNERPGSAPATTNPTDSLETQIVAWVNDAYREILRDQDDWRFMRGSFSYAVAGGVDKISKATLVTAISTFDELIPFVMGGQNYMTVTASGETGYTRCLFEPYSFFRGWRDAGTTATGRPVAFTIDNDDGILLAPQTSGDFTLACDYRKTETDMSGVADAPIFPARYHEAIGYRAAALYCEQRPDAERFAQMQRAYLDILDSMRGEQLEVPRFCLTEYY